MPKPTKNSSDCLIVGGGVVGLSIAYQLALDGLSVRLLERHEVGKEASWAGAGMLPPGSWYSSHPAMEELAKRAASLYPNWSSALKEETGIDNEYWQCGSRYMKSPASAPFYQSTFERWRTLGIEVDETTEHYEVPAESQIRNPRHLQALAQASSLLGVAIEQKTPVQAFEWEGDRIITVETANARFSAKEIIIAAGCWTPALANQLGVRIPGRPVRGQMLLLKPNRPEEAPSRIIHRAPYYLVPRRDGLLLVGATVEQVGFDRRNTEEAFQALRDFAREVCPSLQDSTIEAFWAGLRPAGGDELPTIGPVRSTRNAWLATGHYRAGLQFSPPTAELISSMIRQTELPMEAAPFSPDRFLDDSSSKKNSRSLSLA